MTMVETIIDAIKQQNAELALSLLTEASGYISDLDRIVLYLRCYILQKDLVNAKLYADQLITYEDCILARKYEIPAFADVMLDFISLLGFSDPSSADYREFLRKTAPHDQHSPESDALFKIQEALAANMVDFYSDAPTFESTDLLVNAANFKDKLSSENTSLARDLDAYIAKLVSAKETRSKHEQSLTDMTFPNVYNVEFDSYEYCLVLTRNCNLACTYCTQRDNVDFSYLELTKVIDSIALNATKQIDLNFYGGEPLIKFSLFQDLFSYAEVNYASQIDHYYLTTNVTLVTNDIAQFLAENRARITVVSSLDGDLESNSARVFIDGSPSFYAAVEGAQKLFTSGADAKIVQFVAHPENVSNVLKNVQFLYTLGYRTVRVSIVDGTEITSDFVNLYIDQMKQVSDFVLEHPDLRIPHLMYHMATQDNGPFQMVDGVPKPVELADGSLASRYYDGPRNKLITDAYTLLFNYHQARLGRN